MPGDHTDDTRGISAWEAATALRAMYAPCVLGGSRLDEPYGRREKNDGRERRMMRRKIALFEVMEGMPKREGVRIDAEQSTHSQHFHKSVDQQAAG
jgi:hypothetical protein